MKVTLPVMKMSEILHHTQPKKITLNLLLLFTFMWTGIALSQVPTSCSVQNVSDNFPNISYSQNSGSENWSGDWTEVGESDGTSAGIARVRNDLCSSGNCLRLGVPSGNSAQTFSNRGVYREADLSDASSATLSFVYRRGVAQGNQTIILSVTNNGGSSWTELQSYFINSTNTAPVTASFDISGYTTSNTQIRFLASGNNAVIGMYIDDITISYQPNCAPTPLLDYHFDELIWNGAPNEVIDNSGNNYDGTALGEITTTTGKVCNAANIPKNTSATTFQAVNSGIDLDNVVGSSGTISLWYKGNSAWNSGDDKRLFDATDGDKYFMAEIGSDGRVKFWFEDGRDGDYQKSTVSAVAVDADVWKHLTFVWDVTTQTAEIYIDGIQQSLSGRDGGTTAFNGFSTIYFGDNRDISYFTGESSADGQIDEALIFNSVLVSTQIQTIFNNQNDGKNYDGSTRTCPEPSHVGFYQFEQSSWPSAGAVIDSSGSNNHGDPLGSISPFLNPITQKSCQALEIDKNTSASIINAVDTGIDINSLGDDGTVSFWYKSKSDWSGGGNRQLIDASTRSAGDKYFFLVLRSNGSLRFGLEYNGDDDLYSTTSNYSFAANEWVHIAVTWNPLVAELELYVNGSKATTTDSIETPEGGSLDEMGTLFIGDNSTTYAVNGSTRNSANGYFDDVRVYNFIQTQSAIVTDMQDVSSCGLVAEYHFDEESWDGSSGEVNDNSTSNFDGRRIGDTTTITEGQVCRAGTFDGTGDYINVDGIDSTLNSTASLSFWIKTTQSGNNTAWSAPGILGIEQRGGSNDIFWGYLDASGHMRIQKGNGSSAQSSTIINNDEWHHVVLTWDSTNGDTQVFVDGNLESSVRSSAGDVSNKFSSIGRIEGSFSRENFNGQLDELLVFNLLLSASDVSAIYTNQLNGDNYDGIARVCPASTVDHFEILHDTSGFTCEAETLTIRACADASCDTLFDQETSITLSPSGFEGGDTLVFTGQTSTNLRVTDEGTVTLAKVNASPDANLTCFNGSTETCDITFANDGFEIYGANIGDALPDQLAADNFLNVNLRAVRSNENVCEALLEGTQEINLTYNCDSPNQCLTQLNGIAISGGGTGDNTGSIQVEFNTLGVASLAVLNYPDAGRLTLSVQAEVEGVTITHSDIEPVDVYPSYLALSVTQAELIYGAAGEQNNYVAGEDFTFVIGAYGTNDNLLPNYQAENPQLKVTKVAPSGTGENGNFKYSGASTRTSTGLFSNTPDISSSTADDHFVAGEYSFNQAYYTEVGRIALDAKDADYLGNEIASNGTLTLGDFYPAYFNVVLTDTPTLADTCGNTFSYLGQTIQFETSPKFTLTAYNALDTITSNYSDTYWNYLPNEATLEANLSYLDSSTYAKEKSASVIDLGDEPLVANNDNYDGSATVTINNGLFRYNKVNPDDDSVFAPVSPFEAQLTLAFASNFFINTFVDQNGIEDSICYQVDYSNNTCLGWDIDEVNGTQMRYGRLTLESTYGPETEPLNVPIKAEYFEDNQWLINTDDNCTNIDFTQSGGEIELTDNSLASLVGSVTSEGTIMLGLSVGNQFELNAPDTAGELNIWLDPTDLDVTWPTYLNYDWNGNGFINTDDFPKATVSFGLFRGNDRIIHWREVFN